jgi:hypothetical protein
LYQIEYAYSISKVGSQLLDNEGEAPGDPLQHSETESQIWLGRDLLQRMRLRDFHHHQSRLYAQEFVTTAQLTITFENGKKWVPVDCACCEIFYFWGFHLGFNGCFGSIDSAIVCVCVTCFCWLV